MARGYQSPESAGQSVQESQPHLGPGHPEFFPAGGSGLWSEDTGELSRARAGPAALGCRELHAATGTVQSRALPATATAAEWTQP